ncbi:MAG TPA: hypothetical protein VGK27_00920, partial [Candidatus Deferrimicrobiaceae bacterium]
WACACLKDPAVLKDGKATLSLDAIDGETPEGKEVLASAREILRHLGKKDAAEITLEDTADTNKVFVETRFNGDGIVIPEAAEDEAVKQVVLDIMACCGEKTDRSGKPGLDQAAVDTFFVAAQAYADWWKEGEAAPAILPLGDATVAAGDAVRAVKAKVDDYFARCRLAAFDARAMQALNREEKDYLAFTAKDLTITHDEIAALPLSHIEADRPLPFFDGPNPAWAARLAQLHAAAVVPLLGPRDRLTEADWQALGERLAAHEEWRGRKAGAEVEKLGKERVRAMLGGPAKDQVTALVDQDQALEPEYKAIANVEKLIRLHRDLYQLLVNFVSFRDFYRGKGKAIFQSGTLYLDQRSCDLCVKVEDMARHGLLAHLSRTFLAYVECVRKATNEKMTVAASFTAGDADNLMVGRNGVFYDRKGQDWDATIVKIVEHPISIRQAFWAPYTRTIRWIEEQVAKRAGAADTAIHAGVTTHGEHVVGHVHPGAPPAPVPAKPGVGAAPAAAPVKPKFDVGVVAALGVAVGGITAALGALLSSFFGLGLWMPLGLVGLMLLISLPSMIIAALKLRQRNLGPILDANGWAVNAKAKINIPFGTSLTGTAKLPKGSRRDLFDPYAEHHSQRNAVIAAAIMVLLAGLWTWGKLDRVLPQRMRAAVVLHREEPKPEVAKKTPPAPAKAPAPAAKAPPAPVKTAAAPAPATPLPPAACAPLAAAAAAACAVPATPAAAAAGAAPPATPPPAGVTAAKK